jgi:hypothetical protein
MFRLFPFPRHFTEGRFWSLYIFAEALMVLDCFTTVIILNFCGGVELNPIVNYFGLFNITVYKIAATAFIGFVSRRKKFLWLLFGLSLVFSFVVLWNTFNILLTL